MQFIASYKFLRYANVPHRVIVLSITKVKRICLLAYFYFLSFFPCERPINIYGLPFFPEIPDTQLVKWKWIGSMMWKQESCKGCYGLFYQQGEGLANKIDTILSHQREWTEFALQRQRFIMINTGFQVVGCTKLLSSVM